MGAGGAPEQSRTHHATVSADALDELGPKGVALGGRPVARARPCDATTR
jgi:hypothetical protein